MKLLIITTLLIGLIGISKSLFAQDDNKNPATVSHRPDTIYYLADSTKIPINDRIVRLKSNWKAKYLLIDCSCTPTDWKGIILGGNGEQGILMDKARFMSLRLTTLANLISIAKEHITLDYDKKYVVYVIEPVDELKYKMYKLNNLSSRGLVTKVY